MHFINLKILKVNNKNVIRVKNFNCYNICTIKKVFKVLAYLSLKSVCITNI